VPFVEPLAAVPLLERDEGHAELLDGVERPHPEQLLLERAGNTGRIGGL
jgi:hypothetical protein